MSCEFLAGKSAEFCARARKLARILDDKFDAFGDLLADDAVDAAAVMLEQIEASGCRLILADEVATGLTVERADLHAAFRSMMPFVRLPLQAAEAPGVGSIQDADGVQVAVVDVDREHTDEWVSQIAAAVVLAVNTCGGFRAAHGQGALQ